MAIIRNIRTDFIGETESLGPREIVSILTDSIKGLSLESSRNMVSMLKSRTEDSFLDPVTMETITDPVVLIFERDSAQNPRVYSIYDRTTVTDLERRFQRRERHSFVDPLTRSSFNQAIFDNKASLSALPHVKEQYTSCTVTLSLYARIIRSKCEDLNSEGLKALLTPLYDFSKGVNSTITSFERFTSFNNVNETFICQTGARN